MTTTGYVRFDSRKRLSLGKFVDAEEGDYARIVVLPEGAILVETAPFPTAGDR